MQVYYPSTCNLWQTNTWIRDFNHLIFLHPGQLNSPDDRPDFQPGKEICEEAKNVEADGVVHVDNVLQGQVAEVEGKIVPAKSLQKQVY